MRAANRAVLAIGLAAAAACLGLVSAQDRPSLKKPAPNDTGLVLRVDLLRSVQAEIPAPKRDIFTPAAAAVPAAGIGAAAPGGIAGAAGAPGGAAGEAAAKEPEEQPLDIRYIGFGRGKTVIMAVVFTQGRAETVAEGEMVGPGWKVLKITPEALEVQSPTGQTRTLAFEGERK